MNIKPKSQAIKALEKMNGGPLTLGKAIYAWRRSQELTQPEMGKRLGISAVHLGQIERGLKFLSPDRAKKFAKKLGHSEKLFVALCLQDQLLRAGIKYKITLEAA